MQPYGYTAQYITIAIALRIALVEYFERAALISTRSGIAGNEELEARRLTIVLLTASLCESCINTALALSLPPADYGKIERRPTLEKWLLHSRRVNSTFALDRTGADGRELQFVFECRNAITHAQPEVHSVTGPIHSGNHGPWELLTHERILPMVTMVVTILPALCAGTAPLIAAMPSSVAWELHLNEFLPSPLK